MILKQKRKIKRLSHPEMHYNLERTMGELPDENAVFKAVARSKAMFTATSFITFVAARTKIDELYIATFHAGLCDVELIDALRRNGRVGAVMMITKSMEFNSAYAKSIDKIKEIFERNGWVLAVVKTHAKVLLFKTDLGYFVLETSSNLDKNQSAEQFSFEQSEELYNYYKTNLFIENAAECEETEDENDLPFGIGEIEAVEIEI